MEKIIIKIIFCTKKKIFMRFTTNVAEKLKMLKEIHLNITIE